MMRWGNPTVRQLEMKLADLEGAEAAVAFGSGMAAATALFLFRLKAGDHLIVSDIAYAGVAELVRQKQLGLGIEVELVDLSDLDALRAALRSHTKMVYAESPANPSLKLTDNRAVAELTHAVGAELAVDSTFATPIATSTSPRNSSRSMECSVETASSGSPSDWRMPRISARTLPGR